ncbi:MAG: alpha-glucan family phosphorylase [Acidimicrobiia bacterium]|nr:alpha-glucan family phosphorylase [Acidimicrobiia bacterium]
MKPLKTYTVVPRLPAELEPLRRVVYDLHWAWNHAAIGLFRRLDGDLWEATGHNPVLMLGSITQDKLDAAAADPAFLTHLERVVDEFETYRSSRSTWFERTHGADSGLRVAYFSLEFGITECLSIFAGGLGILAGDHLKSASDLGVPLTGVGLLYQEGYFRQQLNEAGWQKETYEPNDFHNLPVELVTDVSGSPLSVSVPFPGRDVTALIWKAQVGRVELYLLDTNHEGNTPDDRRITDQLYGGSRETRMKQELLLGVGGFRALEELGIEPTVYHMNEGHSAFLVLEWIARLMASNGLTFAEAKEAASGLVFTTHTPVPAGHDYFPPDLVTRYLGRYAEMYQMSPHEFVGLGRRNPGDSLEEFCNTILALDTAAFSNGVSKLHGVVSRNMWTELWPQHPVEEIPITSITNGVHAKSWVSQEMKDLYDRYLGPQWREEPADAAVWKRVRDIPPAELWRTRERRRERLVAFARRRLARQLAMRGAPQAEVEMADVVLDPHALTVGFARRFATYKRADLVLQDTQRLLALMQNTERPVQFIFAGKAHPADDGGKRLIQKLIDLTRNPEIWRHLVFIADYDMSVARALVQGADVWLNTPVRPLEASGTSGMKAAVNGVLNLSTLDGWWDEAYEDGVGWAIGRRETHPDPAQRDRFEAHALYDLLERDVAPLFYDRGVDGLPRGWLATMQKALSKLNSQFNTHRMVREYTEKYYLPAGTRQLIMGAEGAARARDLAGWKERVRSAWPQIRVMDVDAEPQPEIVVRDDMAVRAQVHLAGMAPDQVTVELYQGTVDADGNIVAGRTQVMEPVESTGDNHWFETKTVSFGTSGKHGFTVRVLPDHPDLVNAHRMGLIRWG